LELKGENPNIFSIKFSVAGAASRPGKLIAAAPLKKQRDASRGCSHTGIKLYDSVGND